MPSLKIGLPKFQLHCSQLALQDWYKKVADSASRLQKARVNPLSLALHEIKHFFNEPRRCEHLTVIFNSLFRFDKVHKKWSSLVISQDAFQALH